MAPRRFKKFNLPRPLRIGNLLVILALLFSGWCFINWLRSFVLDSPYFRIDRVEIALVGNVPLSENAVRDLLNVHRGHNIFSVNLKATKDYIMLNYPEVRTLSIERALPDKLILKVRPRKPVAQAGLSSGFCLIDGEGIILTGIKGLAQENLPIISGLDARFLATNRGKRCEYDGLKRALGLLEIINQTGFSGEHEVHMIDASDPKNLSFYIEGGIEIKIGGENFRERIMMLNKTFNTARFDKSQIRYVDLRFGNVIIGPK